MFRGLICAQSAFHFFFPFFLSQHAAHHAAGKPHLSFSNTPAVVDYHQLLGFPYQGGSTELDALDSRGRGRPNGPTSSNHVQPFVSPAGSNFVDLRKGHGRTSFVSLVAGHVW